MPLTPSQIGQIRTVISYIDAVATEMRHNSGLLGRAGSNEKTTLNEIRIELDQISDAVKHSKKLTKQK